MITADMAQDKNERIAAMVARYRELRLHYIARYRAAEYGSIREYARRTALLYGRLTRMMEATQ